MLTLAMPRHEWMLLLGEVLQVVWVFAFGSCVGSLLNVLVYRLPLGLDVVTPSSRCPNCDTKLTWRENIPVFGWLWLGGKCRFCRSPISAEYPIVEAFTGLLWVVVYLVCFSDGGTFLGIPFGRLEPEWAAGGFRQAWPTFLVILCLFSCLIAVTLIDARTFQIPMSLNWVPVAFALVVHPLHAAWLQHSTYTHGLLRPARGWHWSIATPGPEGWWWIGAALGGAVGVVAACVLLWKGVITRSFSDYDEWLEGHKKDGAGTGGGATRDVDADLPLEDGDAHPEVWTQYPHARREMLRELIFLAPIAGLALLGGWAAYKLAGPWTFDPVTVEAMPAHPAPLWLMVLAGVLLGYLIGGGVVWFIRIVGSLAFGKEALGLGDVHLMAAVGACLGWIDAVLGFFGAAFVGLAWAILGKVFSGKLARHMPFGPYLAAGTVLVWFFKPAVEVWLALLTHARGGVQLP